VSKLLSAGKRGTDTALDDAPFTIDEFKFGEAEKRQCPITKTLPPRSLLIG
jgi:hypothetical protein